MNEAPSNNPQQEAREKFLKSFNLPLGTSDENLQSFLGSHTAKSADTTGDKEFQELMHRNEQEFGPKKECWNRIFVDYERNRKGEHVAHLISKYTVVGAPDIYFTREQLESEIEELTISAQRRREDYKPGHMLRTQAEESLLFFKGILVGWPKDV